jgi:hypothetical protein
MSSMMAESVSSPTFDRIPVERKIKRIICTPDSSEEGTPDEKKRRIPIITFENVAKGDVTVDMTINRRALISKAYYVLYDGSLYKFGVTVDTKRCVLRDRTSSLAGMIENRGPTIRSTLFLAKKTRPNIKKSDDWTNLGLHFEVLDDKTEFCISDFYFDGPDGNQNRDQHASLALLILIEFLEKNYSYKGWHAPKILTWSLLTQPTGCDKRTPDLVQAFERNAEMRTIVKSVLTNEDATDKRKCVRKLATTRR